MNEYISKAESFLCDCLHGGLAHSYSVKSERYVKPYPEVTGYVIKYFCDNKSIVPEIVIKAGEKLVELQDEEMGGYASFYDQHILYVFDTAQIVRGLCALYNKTGRENFIEAAINGTSFILSSQESNGAFRPIYNTNNSSWIIRDETYSLWNGPFSGLMCKTAECLIDMYSTTKNPAYIESVKKIRDFYKNSQYIEYSHPLGYWLEGLLVTENVQLVDEVIESKILNRINENGYISYTEGLNYAYVSGTIQLGIILFKRGFKNEAIKIRDYGRSVQSHHHCGGLFQYADADGGLVTSIHDEINSWGTKYFCELERLIENDLEK